MYVSVLHRGTPQSPGLVLALAKRNGSECVGLAFQIASENQEATLAYLRKQELMSSTYLEVSLEISDLKGKGYSAITYFVEQTNQQYCAELTLSQLAVII